MKRCVPLGAAIALALSVIAVAQPAGTALATPGSGITPADLARGTSAAAYTITAEANREVATQTNTYAPGGSTSGWHTHPGPVVTIVKSGTLSLWYSSDCTRQTLTPGQAIVVPGGGMYDLGRNESATEPLVIVQTFYNVPVGGPLRTDAPAPQCTSAVPSVPQDMAIVGVTGTLHARARVAPAINITGAANTDLYIQQLTAAPGGQTGWHSHPGPVTVLMNSGTLTYQHSNCFTNAYPAGTGFIDPGMGNVHLARNDGTTSSVFFATYTNLPVGGAARIDAAAPACAAHPFTDIAGHPFEGEIIWLYHSGITAGCTSNRFCPDDSVTREQMASFLVRALGPLPTTTDFFTDDENSVHESDINRLAASGITFGCGGGRFCPTQIVSREQMASFLVRGWGPPATSTDFFSDDETSIHESDINRLAASGITTGCGGSRFCPLDPVARGQMAAFLYRAIT